MLARRYYGVVLWYVPGYLWSGTSSYKINNNKKEAKTNGLNFGATSATTRLGNPRVQTEKVPELYEKTSSLQQAGMRSVRSAGCRARQ